MVDLSAKTVTATEQWADVDSGDSPAGDSVVLASIDSFNGSDTAAVRMRNPNADTMEVRVEEEQSAGDEMEHNREVLGLVRVNSGRLNDDSGTRVGESGLIQTDQADAGQWQSVNLDGSYSDPVVFMQVMSYNGGNPSHTRLRNVSSSSFEYQIEEWDYLDGQHTTETLGYVVLESGIHALENGGLFEVGTVETNHTWTNISFGGDVGSDPVLISRCQTYHGNNEIVTRNRQVSESGAEIRLQEEEGRDGDHTTETVGYVVSRRTTTNITTGKVDAAAEWVDAGVPGVPSTDTVVISSIETSHGNDPVGVRLRNVGANGLQLFLEEETSGGDSETGHVYEHVGLFTTESGPIHDTGGSQIGEADITSTDQPSASDWHTVNMDGSYTDPVVFMQVMSYNGSDPAHTRLRNVSGGSFDFRIEEWNYLNGQHNTEKLGYVVLETGLHELEGGIPIEAGTISATEQFSDVSFSGDFSCPVFLSRCQTFNGSHEVVTRNQDVHPEGAWVRVQEEAGRDGQHTQESVGYLAVPQLTHGGRRSSDTFRPDCHGFMFPNRFTQLPDLPDLPQDIDSQIEDFDQGYGLCGGMVLAARDFFLNDRPIPDVGHPPGSGALFDYLWERQIDSFDRSNAYQYLAKFVNFYLPSTFTRAKSVDELKSVKHALDGGPPQILGLVYMRAGSGNIWENHQVLAIDYTESGDTTTLSVYDPNYPDANNIEIRVNLKDQGIFDPAPGDSKIDAEQYQDGTKLHDVIGVIHMDVVSQAPPPNL